MRKLTEQTSNKHWRNFTQEIPEYWRKWIISFKDNAGATKDQFELYSNQNTKILVYSGKKIGRLMSSTI